LTFVSGGHPGGTLSGPSTAAQPETKAFETPSQGLKSLAPARERVQKECCPGGYNLWLICD